MPDRLLQPSRNRSNVAFKNAPHTVPLISVFLISPAPFMHALFRTGFHSTSL